MKNHLKEVEEKKSKKLEEINKPLKETKGGKNSQTGEAKS